MFIAAQFTVAKCWKQLKCPLVNESKNCGTFTQWNTMHRKKEETPTLHYSMDGTGEHYANWSKPGGERQIPYDLTYKWNLINLNKQAKNKQRHWNKEQTDSNQRGEGRGIMGENGEGSSRNMYKQPMDKANGVGTRVGGKWRQLYLNNN